MDPRQQENISFFFLLAKSSRLPRDNRTASFHRLSSSRSLLPNILLSIYFSILPHSPRSLVHDPRNKDPEEAGKNGIEGKLLALAGIQPANSRDACGNYIRSARHPEKKMSSASSPKKKNSSGDVWKMTSFLECVHN